MVYIIDGERIPDQRINDTRSAKSGLGRWTGVQAGRATRVVGRLLLRVGPILQA
jgi:hypothetical protein